MNRHHHIDRPAAPPTRGEDPARPACEGNWEPFDVLMDKAAGPASRVAVRAALDICNGCPIKAKCWADNAGEKWVQALQQPDSDRQPCGTPAAYDWHKRHGEEACAPCKRAAAAKSRDRRRAAEKKPVRRPICGTDSGYQGHRRRGETACDPCKAAHRAANRKREAE